MADLTDEQLADVLHRLLMVGVPPSALAKAFDLEVGGIRELQSQVRVEQYGTAELTEAMTYLIWQGYENALHMMNEGTPANRMRMTGMILSRSISIAGRQPPESMNKVRDLLLEIAQANSDNGNLEPGPFVMR